MARGAMVQVRLGLQVFRRPRLGAWATLMQLTAWAIQWIACYVLLVALGLDGHAGIGAAAAVLFAVNVTAALPATPSNLGVFQAACVAVLSAYGVSKTNAFAYGVILQAVEIATALAMGMPALLREGMTWKDLRLQGAARRPGGAAGAARESAEAEGAAPAGPRRRQARPRRGAASRRSTGTDHLERQAKEGLAYPSRGLSVDDHRRAAARAWLERNGDPLIALDGQGDQAHRKGEDRDEDRPGRTRVALEDHAVGDWVISS